MTWVFARFQVAGFHHWPDAPDHRSYLRDRHRHMFRVEVAAETTVSREVEFHDLYDDAFDSWVARWPEAEHGSLSCEEIAQQLAARLPDRYDELRLRIEVSEDGEVGARIEVGPA